MDLLRKECIVKDSFITTKDSSDTEIKKDENIEIKRDVRNTSKPFNRWEYYWDRDNYMWVKKTYTYSDRDFLVTSPSKRRARIYSNEKIEIKNIVDNYVSLLKNIKNPDPIYEIVKYSDYFHKRGTYILANLDFLFNFTGQEDGYIKPQIINEKYSYLVLDGDLGSLEYLQYRLPASTAISKCSVKEENTNLDKKFINFSCNEDITEYALYVRPEGVDLVTNIYFEGYEKYREDVIKALLTTKIGGTYVAKVSLDLRDRELGNILKIFYLLSIAFEKVTVLKAFLDSEWSLHVVAENYRGKNGDILQFLNNLDKVNISDSFTKYLYEVSENIKKENTDSLNKRYNFYKCIALLNLF